MEVAEVLASGARLAKVAYLQPEDNAYAGYLKSIGASAASLGGVDCARCCRYHRDQAGHRGDGAASHGGLIIFPDLFTAANHLFIIGRQHSIAHQPFIRIDILLSTAA